MSAKSRWTINKKVRRFQKISQEPVDFRKYTKAGFREFHEIAFPLSQRTYQSALLDFGLQPLDEFTRMISDSDDWRGYVLLSRNRPVAYMSLPATCRTLIYDRLGYDQAFRKLSPGTVLQYQVIRDIFEERLFNFLDLTAGEGLHKELFANGRIESATILYFRNSIKPLFALAIYAGFIYLSQFGVRLLDWLQVKVLLKHALRRLSARRGINT
jgi:hypothetical protein